MATVRMPSSCALRKTRMAISLRLATRSFVIFFIDTEQTPPGGFGAQVDIGRRSADQQRTAPKWPTAALEISGTAAGRKLKFTRQGLACNAARIAQRRGRNTDFRIVILAGYRLSDGGGCAGN